MIPEVQRIAIAEACGLRKVKESNGLIVWVDGQDRCTFLPDYLNDLNACHEMVKVLTENQKHDYAVILASMFWPMGWQDWRNTVQVSEAAAAQRCEAFLKTLNLWQESSAADGLSGGKDL